MDCHEAQALINKYVHNELDVNTLEDFLLHVEQCSDCMEELEVYYIVFQGFRRLDEDDNIAVNYHEEFLKTLSLNKDRIRRFHSAYLFRRISFLLLLIIIMVVSTLSINQEAEQVKLIYRSEGQSEFTLPTYYFKNRKTMIDEYLQQKYGIDYETLSHTNIDLATLEKQ